MLLVLLCQLCLVTQRIRYMEQGAGGVQYNFSAVGLQLIQQLEGPVVVIAPDILSVYSTGKQHLVLREAIGLYQRQRLLSFQEIQADSVKRQCADICIAVPDISEIGLEQNTNRALCCQDFGVQLTEQRDFCLCEIHYQVRFIQLCPCCTQGIQFLQISTVSRGNCICKILCGLFTSETRQLQEGKRADEHRLSADALCLCFFPFCKRLCAGKTDFCGVFDFRHHIMIIGIKPLLHCKGLYIAFFSLIASCHCKIGVQVRQFQCTITRRNGIQQHCGIQHVVIKGKVIGRNPINSRCLLQCPVCFAQFFCCFLQFFCGNLLAKIGFTCKFQFPKAPDSGKSNYGCFHIFRLHFCYFSLVF